MHYSGAPQHGIFLHFLPFCFAARTRELSQSVVEKARAASSLQLHRVSEKLTVAGLLQYTP